MASQQDLQELLRLLTVGKVPIKDAMMRVKALQGKNLRSIKQIAEAPLSDIEAAIPDTKAARSLHNACKARVKNPNVSSTSKRAGAELLQSAKRARTTADGADFLDGPAAPLPPAEYEASLALPAAETDAAVLARTTLVTNRAPLVLAFAVELLRYTMPEQPPSARLSLAQAVVSANSRSKAVSIGLEKGRSADDEGFGHGQPRVRIMGREVAVLKRGGYEWRGEEEVEDRKKKEEEVEDRKNKEEEEDRKKKEDEKKNTEPTQDAGTKPQTAQEGFAGGVKHEPGPSGQASAATAAAAPGTWSASTPVTARDSTFIARATQITAVSQRGPALQALFAAVPQLRTASHNMWACRVKKPDMFGSFTVREDADDDGEGGAGEFMLKNLREADALNVLVVITRWYGGVMIGPDRWRIMRSCLKEALAERLRVTGEGATLGGEAVWGLDLEAMKGKAAATAPSTGPSRAAGVVGMPIHRPEAARAYLLRSFADRIEEMEANDPQQKADDGEEKKTITITSPSRKRTTVRALNAEKEENLGRLLGALRLLYDSWSDHLSPAELDRRAWGWYVAVRPEVESGPSGWGAKGHLKLKDILARRRMDS